MALLQAMEQAGKKGDLAAAAAHIDFPVLMVTDDTKGQASGDELVEGAVDPGHGAMYEQPMDVKMTHRPQIFLASDSLATLNDEVTMTMGKQSIDRPEHHHPRPQGGEVAGEGDDGGRLGRHDGRSAAGRGHAARGAGAGAGGGPGQVERAPSRARLGRPPRDASARLAGLLAPGPGSAPGRRRLARPPPEGAREGALLREPEQPAHLRHGDVARLQVAPRALPPHLVHHRREAGPLVAQPPLQRPG